MPNPWPTNFIKRVVQIYVEQSPFFNEIDLYPHNSSHLKSTIKLIRRTSSIINQLLGLYMHPLRRPSRRYPLTCQRPSAIDKDSLLLLIGYFVFTQLLRLA